MRTKPKQSTSEDGVREHLSEIDQAIDAIRIHLEIAQDEIINLDGCSGQERAIVSVTAAQDLAAKAFRSLEKILELRRSGSPS